MKVSLANTVVLKGDYFSSSITWFLIDGEFGLNIIGVNIMRYLPVPFHGFAFSVTQTGSVFYYANRYYSCR